jgi:hypothetical protein
MNVRRDGSFKGTHTFAHATKNGTLKIGKLESIKGSSRRATSQTEVAFLSLERAFIFFS